MYTKYTDKNIQKKIVAELDKNKKFLFNIITDVTSTIKKIVDIQNDYISQSKLSSKFAWSYDQYTDYTSYINKQCYNIQHKIVKFFAILTDLFFIRRFLDKSYITNGISYTGGDHSVQYIYYLVNLFDFKVTHFSYSKIENISALDKEIKKINIDDMYKIFTPLSHNQCSDMSTFPKKFE